jgi:hypothetical protein
MRRGLELVSGSSSGGPSSSSSLTSVIVISLALSTKSSSLWLSPFDLKNRACLQNSEMGFLLWEVKRETLREFEACKQENESEDEADDKKVGRAGGERVGFIERQEMVMLLMRMLFII